MEKKDFYVVGIGSSAGGYDALREFFKEMPEKPGVAFVIIQHLSREHKSLTAEWLTKVTPMNIISVQEETKILPNQVYLLPENMLLKIKNDNLVLEKRDSEEIINLAVDVFFHSLAEAYKERAIAIVLSGAGTDGSRGILSIKDKGGLVFVQQPDSANFESMPSVAIATDHPDIILPPAEMAKKLLHFLKNPVNMDDENIENATSTDREVVQDIIHQVSQFSNVNFQAYKINTIFRRIEKRTKLNHLTNIQEYQEFLKHNPEEIQILYNDLLIGVTNFFRDAVAFKSLEKNVIANLFSGKKDYETVRIWVIGCSTGEEAYSVAILCEEYIQKHNLDITYKIFATDLDSKAIELASVGRFRNDIIMDVSPERRERFFNKVGDFYEIKKVLRKKIIFARHNLMNDPPFISQDLITCRNLFIYFKPEIQKKLLSNYNYSLKPHGYLFLGANESSEGLQNLFEPIDSKWKIFQNNAGQNRRSKIIDQYTSVRDPNDKAIKSSSPRGQHIPVEDEHEYDNIIVNEYAPDCLIINVNNELVYTNGKVDKYLSLPKKKMNYDIFNMLSGNLPLIFRNGIRKLIGGERLVTYNDILIDNGETQERIMVRFKAINNPSHKYIANEQLVLVEFIVIDPERKSNASEINPENTFENRKMEELERELDLTKKELQFSVDELETLNEELQASNEEMYSSNEELQSTNEEMQSSNEELHTVNIELKNKIEEISSLHDDITNFFNNTEIAIIFLDQDLRIRKFTPASRENFNFIENDIGRPIDHLTHNFDYDRLKVDAKSVLQNLTPIVKEIKNKVGQTYMVRMLPYKTDDMRIQGIVITFVEISDLKKATIELKKRTEALERSEQNIKSLVENTPDLVARVDAALNFIFVNRAIKNLFDIDPEKVLGKSPRVIRLWDKKGREIFLSCLQKAIDTGYAVNEYIDFYQKDKLVCFYVKFVPEFSLDEKTLESVLIISRDITDVKKHEFIIEQQNSKLKKVNIYLDNFIHIVAHDLRSPVGNLKLLMSIFHKTDDVSKKMQFIDKIDSAVCSLDNTLKGLMEIVELQNENKGNEKTLSFEKVLELFKVDYVDQIAVKGINFVVNFDACPQISYIEGYLLSILKNLVSNAIKYADENKDSKITITTERSSGYILLTVKDNGIGIDMERHKERLFMPFKRFTTKAEGKGIGLNIIKTMIEKNGGKIEVESELEVGTTFYVYLKEY